MSDITKLLAYLPYVTVLFIPGFVYTATREFLIGRDMQPITFSEGIRILIRSVFVNTVTELILLGLQHEYPAAAATFFQSMEVPLVSGNLRLLVGSGLRAWNTLQSFLFLPAAYGAFIGVLRRNGWSLREWLRRHVKNLAQVSDQATDQAIFVSLNNCKQADKTLVIGVKTREGMLYGRFGSQSMLSHSGGYRDLYLEETWEEDADGNLAKASDASSLLVKGSVIEALIFFYV